MRMVGRRRATQIQTKLFKPIQLIVFHIDFVEADQDTAQFRSKPNFLC